MINTDNTFCSKPGADILIVDPDTDTKRLLLQALAGKSLRGTVANDYQSAIDILEKQSFDLIFLRRDIPTATNSFKLLNRIKKETPELPVIMMASAPPLQQYQQLAAAAVEALKCGIYDFVVKPLDRNKIEQLLDHLVPNQEIHQCVRAQEDDRTVYRIVGKSPKLKQTVQLAKQVAASAVPVLICGESGTGKELISGLIHYYSQRVDGAYIRLNCAALNDSLLESELFGHEKGAFTGALDRRKGRFEMAHGGTLLLDEITETPLNFQAKLLRVLEQQDFERVGGNHSVKVNVRIISTTNKNLLDEVQKGTFRQDLYYRLSGIRIQVPPLRDRKEDIEDLVWYFVNEYVRQTRRTIESLDPAMMDIFSNYHWPGNIRQLRNVVVTSLILGNGPVLTLADVSWLFDELQPMVQEPCYGSTTALDESGNLGGVPLEAVERQAILDTLRQNEGNKTQAARILGISDRTLRDKIRKYREQGHLQPA